MTEKADDASKEVTSNVFASDRDRGGNDAPPVADKAPAEVSPVATPEPSSDNNPDRHVPLRELLAERSKFKDQINGIQTRFDEEMRKRDLELAEMRGRFSQQAPQRRQEQLPPPDPLEDPRGAFDYLAQNLTARQLNDRNELSRRYAERTLGKDVVAEAIKQAPTELCNHLYATSPDPWGDLVEWHKEQKARAEVGTDLDAFKKRIADEAVSKALAGLKQGNGGQQQFPGTLAAATAAGQQGSHLSQMTPTADVFGSDRRNRGRG